MKPVVFFGYFLTLDEFKALPKDRQDAVEDEFITGSTGLEVILNPDSVAFGIRMIDGSKLSGDFAELDVNLSRKIRMPIFIQKLETSMNRIFYGGKPRARPPRIGLIMEQDVHKMSESVMVTCEECGTEFEAGKRNARYCPKCRSDRRIEQNFQAAQRYQKDESRRIGSEEVCECGKTYTVTSGRNRKCPECRAKDRAQYVRDFQRKKFLECALDGIHCIGFDKNDKESIHVFNMKETDIMLGKTPAKSYEWTDKEGKPVAKFHTFDWWDGKYIEDLKVSDQYKGRGYSYQLLDYATKALGVRNLAVDKTNTIAKHVYDKYGFKIVDQDDTRLYMKLEKKVPSL